MRFWTSREQLVQSFSVGLKVGHQPVWCLASQELLANPNPFPAVCGPCPIARRQRGRFLASGEVAGGIHLTNNSICLPSPTFHPSPPPPNREFPQRQQAARQTLRRLLFANPPSLPHHCYLTWRIADPRRVPCPAFRLRLGSKPPPSTLPRPRTFPRPDLEQRIARGQTISQTPNRATCLPILSRGRLSRSSASTDGRRRRIPCSTAHLGHARVGIGRPEADEMASPQQMGIDTSRRNRVPRPLNDDERMRLDEFVDSIHYSTRYVAA